MGFRPGTGATTRAVAETDDYLAEEPCCTDVPSEAVRERVLDEIQSGFPLESKPYAVLAERLGLARYQVIEAVSALRGDGTIRQIAASLSSRKLGCISTLCALTATGDQDRIDRIGDLVSAHPEVTHNYQRDAEYNIWFTAIAPSEADLERLVVEVAAETGCEVLNLPVTSLYKIRVDFGKQGGKSVGATGRGRDDAESDGAAGGKDSSGSHDALGPKSAGDRSFDANDPFDVALVRWAQADVVGERPFRDGAAQIAAETGDASVDEERVLQRLRELKADGTIRRFGAFVRHRKLGYAFNGMTVWNAPEDQAANIGKSLAALPYVSHCYARRPAKSWPYNLYAMVHAKTQGELDGYVDEMRRMTGLEPRVLVSTKEYKKVLPTYFA